MAKAGDAYIDVHGNFLPLEKEMAALPTSRIGKKMTSIGRGLTAGLTAPLVAIGAVAVKSSLDFERSMTLISTQAGGSKREVKKLSKELLSLSKKGRFTQGPQELSEALFHIESVGLRGAKAMRALKASADLANVGNSDLESTTNALVGAMKTGIEGAGNMREAIGTLNATIGAGNLRMEDLTAALGTGFLVNAKAVGLTLRDAGAALAELTAQGVPATAAATRLRMTFSLLAAPTDKAKDALKSIGLEESDLAEQMRKPNGLVKAITLLKEHLGDLNKIEQTQLLSAAFGGARSGTTIMALVGNLGDLNKKYQEIGTNSDNFNEKLKETNEEAGIKLEKSLAALKATMIELGDALLPVVIPALQKLLGVAQGLLEGFTGLSPAMKSLVVDVALGAAALGPLLIIGGKLISTYGKLAFTLGKAGAAIGLFNASQATGAFGGTTSFARGTQAAGPAAAKSLAFGLTRALGPALAAAGIANIVFSATQGDMKEAGFKAGGALVGGIAGAVLGKSPQAAALGAGLGSFAGGILAGLFESTKKLTPLQKRLSESSAALASALKKQHLVAGLAAEGQDRLHRAEVKVKRTGIEQVKAQEHLNEVREKGKAGSHDLLRAEARVHAAFHKNTKAINDLRFAKEALEFLDKARGRTISQVVHESSLAIAVDKKWIRSLEARAKREGFTTEVIEKVHQAEKKTSKDLAARSQALQQARHVNKDWAKSLENMTLAQHKFGADGKAAVAHVEALREKLQGLRQSISGGKAPLDPMNDSLRKTQRELRKAEANVRKFTVGTGPRLKNFAQAAKVDISILGSAFVNMASTAGSALATLQNNTQGVLRAYDAADIPVFAVIAVPGAKGKQRGGRVGLQQGGFTVPGTGTGDSFPFLAENGGFVLNRKASKAYGFARGGYTQTMLEPRERYFSPAEVRTVGRGNLEAANASVPRFAKGGLVEPKISGGGALGVLGQAMVHKAYLAAQGYIQKHKPKMAGVDLSGISGSVASIAAQVAKRAHGGKKVNLSLFEALWAESGMGSAAPGNVLQALEPYTKVRPAAQEISGYLTGSPTWTGTSAIGVHRDSPGLPAHAIAQLVQKSGVGEGNEGRANYLVQKGRALSTMAAYGLQSGGNVFDPKLMSGSRTAGPRKLLAGAAGFLPKTIERIKAKADAISAAFIDYSYGGGHGEGTHVNSNRIDCSAAIAKLVQRSGWTDFPVGTSGTYTSIFQPGAGDLFTIWSNAGHTLAEIEGKMWGTYSGGLGYHSHTKSGFVPRHPILNTPVGGGAGGSGSGTRSKPKPKAKPNVKGSYPKHPAGSTGQGGGTYGQTVRGKFFITTSKLNFGELPKTQEACYKELSHLEKVVLPEYRAAARQSKDDKPTLAALRVNIRAIEVRIRALRTQVTKLRLGAIKKHLSKRLANAMARITGWEGGIELQEKAYDRAVEYAQQVVELEPIEPGTVTKDWVDNVLTPYIRNQEEPALGTEGVLGRELSWRNTILNAEEGVRGMEYGWVDEAKGLTSRIGNIKDNIDAANHRVGNLTQLINKYPNAKDRPQWIAQKKAIEANLPELHAKLNSMRTRKGMLISAIGEAKQSFDPWTGTGAFEESLTQVQGIHWPGLHEKLGALPGARAAGSFGGAIWDTQGAIAELGMRIVSAAESVAAGGAEGGSEGDGEKTSLLEELILRERTAKAVSQAQYGALKGFSPLKNFGGSFATGGIVSGPAGAARVTIAHGGEGVFTADQMAAMGGNVGEPTIIVHGDIVSQHKDPVEMLIGDARFPVAVQKVTGKDDRRLGRRLGKGLPGKAGRFGG